MSNLGAPSILDDQDRIDRFLGFLNLGMYINQACDLVGWSESVYHKWRKIGEEAQDIEQSNRDDRQQQAVEFVESVKRARAEAEAYHIRNLRRASDDGSWQASAWWLERSFPERWGRKDRVEVTGKDDGPLVVELEFSD